MGGGADQHPALTTKKICRRKGRTEACLKNPSQEEEEIEKKKEDKIKATKRHYFERKNVKSLILVPRSGVSRLDKRETSLGGGDERGGVEKPAERDTTTKARSWETAI